MRVDDEGGLVIGHDTTEASRPGRGRATAAAGVALSGLGVGFVAVTARQQEAALRAALEDADVIVLVAAALLAALAMVLIALPWRGAIRLAGGADLGRARVLAAFFRGEIAKYVPGGVWAVVGRGVWARRAGVPARAAALSVPLSLVAMYTAAALVAAAGWVATGAGSGLARAMVALAGAAVAVSLRAPALKRWLGRWMGERDRAPREAVRLVAAYVPAWAAVIAATLAAAVALGAEPSLARFWLAVPVAWLAGFLVAPAPAGLGVREAVFAVSCGLDPGAAAATAILARGLFVGVDVLAFGAAAMVGRHR